MYCGRLLVVGMRCGSRKEPGGCSAFLLSDNQYWDRLLERVDQLNPWADSMPNPTIYLSNKKL